MVSGEHTARGGEHCLQKHEVIQALDRVRLLIRNDNDLDCDDSDEFLLRFIKACDCDPQKSYELVVSYFRAKKDYQDEFLFYAPSKYVEIISRPDLGYVQRPGDSLGRPILFLRFGNIDPAQESWPQMMQSGTVILESLSLEPEVQETGVILVVDCTNFSLKIMKWATPHKLSAIMKFFQECVPVRFEFVHIVNAPLAFKIFFTALSPFMRDELRPKLVWHKSPFKTLLAELGPSNTPSHLGGDMDVRLVEHWYKDLVLDKETTFKRFFPHMNEKEN